MTAWREAPPGVPEDELMWRVIAANVEEGPTAEVEMTMGLQQLASILLVKLSDATQQSESEILQEIARRHT
jgi:hypothetical protein